MSASTDTATPLSNSERACFIAKETLGDLSKATIQQLVALFDACEYAGDVWLSAINKPRSGYRGDDERVPDVIEDEQNRLWHMQETIVKELQHREPTPKLHDEHERACIFIRWYQVAGEDNLSLYADGMKILTAISPSRRAVLN